MMDGTLSSSVTKCKRDVLAGTHSWRIEGITDLLKAVKDCEQPTYHACPFFLLGCQWKALFWPCGNSKKEFEDVATLQLTLISSPQQRKQCAKITVEVAHRPETRQHSKLLVFEPFDHGNGGELSTTQKAQGFKNFLKHQDLLTAVKKEDDSITLEIGIELVTVKYDRHEVAINTATTDQLADIQSSLLQKKMMDVTLSTAGNGQVPANIFLLCQASPVLAAQFKYNAADISEKHFTTYSAPVVTCFVKFCCAGIFTAPTTLEELLKLYELAHEKMVTRLVGITRSVLLRNHIQVDSIYILYEVAQQFNDTTFIRHLEDFARSNIPALLRKRRT